MKTYSVTVPFTGTITIEVEADSEDDAIDAALESDELTMDNLDEWEAHRQIVQGNVFRGVQNEAEAVCVDDDDDS